MQDFSSYCREIETYLCRKNEGHLVRIVGPAFERVCGWAARGVPLKMAFRGIDQYCERYYAKGPRRRPVRIEFCEADILDIFEGWRRAIGVGTTGSSDVPVETVSRKPSLASHVERVIARLVAMRTDPARARGLGGLVDPIVRELDEIGERATKARGPQRAAIVARLAAMDRALLDAAEARLGEAEAGTLTKEAEAELAPFGARMPPGAREKAIAAAFDRLVRDAVGLPVLTYE